MRQSPALNTEDAEGLASTVVYGWNEDIGSLSSNKLEIEYMYINVMQWIVLSHTSEKTTSGRAGQG